MNGDLDDRLLEHVLCEMLAPRDEADLSAAVALRLAAVRRRSRALPARAPRLRWRAAVPYLVGAAAVAVLVLVLVQRPATWTASRDLLAGAAGAPLALASTVAAGDVVWCTGGEAATVSRSGMVLQVSPGAAFAVSAHDVELLAGEIEARAGDSPWLIRSAAADVTLAPGSVVRCQLAPFAPDSHDPSDSIMNSDQLRARLRTSAGGAIFTLTVLAGSADFATAQAKETVQTGETRTSGAVDPAIAALARELYSAVRRELPDAVDEATMMAWKEADEKNGELMRLIVQKPASFASARELLLQDLANTRLDPGTRSRVLKLALLDEDRRSFDAATKLWPVVPDAFHLDEQLALAERGFAPARLKLAEVLAQKADGSEAKFVATQQVRAAATLAMTGDASVRSVLQRFAATTMADAEEDYNHYEHRCLAAAALHALGDGEAAKALKADLTASVETWLATNDLGRLALADWCVQKARYYLGTPKPRVSWSDVRADAAVGARTMEPTAESVRKALNELE